MRDIIFRGKRIDNGEWIEGYYAKQSNHACFARELKYQHFIFKDVCLDFNLGGLQEFEVQPETIGQYTGLTDKNGRRIFEGDIILFEDESPANYEYHDFTEMRCGEIKFGYGEFYITNRIAVEMDDLIYDEKFDGVIVGNIHDNPELL